MMNRGNLNMGRTGILGMPFGPFLYGDQIRTALRAKAHQK